MRVLKLRSDIETPVSALLKFRKHFEDVFLLESAEHGANFGRFSFIGLGAVSRFVLEPDGRLFINSEEVKVPSDKKPLHFLLDWVNKFSFRINGDDLPPFTGGAVGWIGYDYVRYIEPKLSLESGDFPEIYFVIPQHFIAFDHLKSSMFIISDDPDKILEILSGPVPAVKSDRRIITTEPMSNFARSDFYKAVEKARQYIIDGDIFQVVLSQRFSFMTYLDKFSIYRALRMVNPSPYMFYLQFPPFTVLGSSPEMMTKCQNGFVYLKPIAGTRKRGLTVEDDLKLEQELKSDEKEIAEHIMLVDLGRNDVGRVSEKGSVKVERLMVIERYSHVMHLVSQVRGKLRKGASPVDALESTFPAGTVSGAPKVRAMEIISELEPDPRGPYGGAVAYVSFPDVKGNHNLDSGILIRSFFFKGNDGFIQAGAGIVYDSKPEYEYKETINKLNALFSALDVAQKLEGGLV